MNWLEFECYIMDLLEDEKLETAQEFQDFSDQLHQHVEIAVEDFCADEGIDDYSPIY